MTSGDSRQHQPPANRRRPVLARARSGAQRIARARRPNPAAGLWAKAQVAVRSARILQAAGDLDGAVNRAYYAVFSAARAALAGVRASLAASKGHGTIVRRFEKHLVQERGVDLAFGRQCFGRLGHARWVADYADAGVDVADASLMVGEAERFLAAVEPFLRKAKP